MVMAYGTGIPVSSLPLPLFLGLWDTDKHDCHGRLHSPAGIPFLITELIISQAYLPYREDSG